MIIPRGFIGKLIRYCKQQNIDFEFRDERKKHIYSLYQFLKQTFEVITLSGDDSDGSRKVKWQLLNSGNYQALVTTGQFFGEGTDLQNASCLFLVYPFSFKGKLIQYIGRVQRSEITPVIYDYRDRKIEYLNRLFLKRNTYYRNFDRQATLFDDTENIGRQFRQKLKSIDQDLNVIRNQGRQAFLEKQRENFSRLIHDYTDERKGFIVWKDKLEERLL